MALISITAMIAEINRKIGNLTGFSAVGGPIERAINDAYMQTILKYKHAEFEVRPPYYFDSEFVVGTDGTNAAYGSTITTSAAAVATFGTRLLSAVFYYDDTSQGTGQTVTAVNLVGGPPYTVTVTPEVQVAHIGQPYKILLNRYPLPLVDDQGILDLTTGKTPFFIYDLTDKTNLIPMKQQDVRVFDRSAIVTSISAMYYARVGNEIVIYPVPLRLNGTTTPPTILPNKMQLRYALRPQYKTGNATLAPMPEEWQVIVEMEAYALVLDDQNEHDRANAIRDSATRLATELMKPYIEEVEDQEPSLTPRLGYY